MLGNAQLRKVFHGSAQQHPATGETSGEFVWLEGERYYKISHFDAIEPFFTSLISSSDHWLFIASTGGLTAGRTNAEQALFPYYTVDKVTENYEHTGHKAILLVDRPDGYSLWEPFSQRQQGLYRLERNLYKNIAGTTLIFEEVNRDLGLTYRYAWRTGEQFGFVKTSWLINQGAQACVVELVDGLQNLLPANISSSTQNVFSVLLDAYKRSELDAETGLGMFALSSNLTDLAEPSEALRATLVAQIGLNAQGYLLSSLQLDDFRSGKSIHTEVDLRGRRPAYFAHARLQLEAGAQQSWHLVADVNQDHAHLAQWIRKLKTDHSELAAALEQDIAANQANLRRIIASADGMQLTESELSTSHHFANVLFNVMRGGIFADQYWVQAADVRDFIAAHAPALLVEQAGFFAGLPERLLASDLKERASATGSTDLARLCASYLPLTFSRRHGDPSRPWNHFNINVKKADGTQRLDYEGNWRDIFQNWEALAWSYPEFTENMICNFLNATTVDGYNPYRIRRDGVDWEHPEPGNPWANIGYWSDHQIVYLQKLMEVSASVHPGALQHWLDRPMFSYANVPYRIKPFQALLQDPYNTIDFDWELHQAITQQVQTRGSSGRLVNGPDGRVFHASLGEKLLTLLLAKLANFVPEGGIWMSTQRPEWNDANNALVGKGLSVVTLGYLRRYLVFCRELFSSKGELGVPVRQEVADFFAQVAQVLQRFQPVLNWRFSDEQRRAMLDALGQAGSDYRWDFYQHGIRAAITVLPAQQISEFCELAQTYVEHSLRANQRPDQLYHAYNILHLGGGQAKVSHLYEMLEGQVAILSSGMLTGEQSLALLRSLRASALYRADQHSYILYPDRTLPGFREKNRIAPEHVQDLELVQALVQAQDHSLILQDLEGIYHFSGHIRNIKDVDHALEILQGKPQFKTRVTADADKIRALFEDTFHHHQFTGRSGTFFAYEGLGSIYWHMVSKLLLAVQEVAQQAQRQSGNSALSQELFDIYYDIRSGLGFQKSPGVYGAFPTDPYSHTPKEQGAKQPGMTGQVKEEILSRKAELGLTVQNGQLVFDPFLLNASELLSTPSTFTWLDVRDHFQSMEIPAGSLVYTFCQVPIVLQVSEEARIEVVMADGQAETVPGNTLDTNHSQSIFQRTGEVHHLRIFVVR